MKPYVIVLILSLLLIGCTKQYPTRTPYYNSTEELVTYALSEHIVNSVKSLGVTYTVDLDETYTQIFSSDLEDRGMCAADLSQEEADITISTTDLEGEKHFKIEFFGLTRYVPFPLYNDLWRIVLNEIVLVHSVAWHRLMRQNGTFGINDDNVAWIMTSPQSRE